PRIPRADRGEPGDRGGGVGCGGALGDREHGRAAHGSLLPRGREGADREERDRTRRVGAGHGRSRGEGPHGGRDPERAGHRHGRRLRMARERLQKILSRAGVASRRAAERMILEGRVEVNGKVVRELGTRADPEVDDVRVDGRPVARVEEKIHLLLYKPPSVVTTLSDPEGRRSVGDLLRSLKVRVFPVGRLDYDAEGALLLTNDGDLAHKLAHPRWGVPRTYRVKVKGFPSKETLERLTKGVRLEDGMARALEVEDERTLLRNAWI